MIIDYLDGACPADIEADLCIIGAGAAGICIARAFIGTGVNVCLVESGGLRGEATTQALYEGSSTGTPCDPANSRMRVFGGSCNLWGGGCMALGAQDLQHRDWVPHSGWPLGYEELEPYYLRARAYCGIESHPFEQGAFKTRLRHPPLPFDDAKLTHQTFIRTSTFFGDRYRPELERAPNIRVLLHANLLEFLSTPSAAAVSAARIGALDGKRGQVRARCYVLACGGIENARLLLLSDSTNPQGLGNDRDLVGRYFMDHPRGKLGTLFTDRPDYLMRPYDRELGRGPAPPFPEICLSYEAQRRHRLLNGRVRPFPVGTRTPKGVQAVRDLRARWRRATVRGEDESLEERICTALDYPGSMREDNMARTPVSTGWLALRMGLGAGDIAKAVGRKLSHRPTVRSRRFDVVGYFEQAPNPDSRITLDGVRDAMGQRKVRVDWKLTDLDLRSYRDAGRLFGEELARASQGRFEPEPWLDAGSAAAPRIAGTAHHMGTTRMAESPDQGVVDRRCKVHGVDNLYVAGSSVFPTGGWAFPTFSIIALSMRLADHVNNRMHDLMMFIG